METDFSVSGCELWTSARIAHGGDPVAPLSVSDVFERAVNPVVLCLEPAPGLTLTQAASSVCASVLSCVRAAACACQGSRQR